jgi:dCTP deaminase
MSILTGPAIEEAVERGEIGFDPYDPAQVNPASYDVRLGDHYTVYAYRDIRYLSVDSVNETETYQIPRDGWVINPGVLYLMHTQERVKVGEYAASIHGKSSIGRLGVVVHSTAGYIDPGFEGQVTLEVTCTQPVRLLRGMRIAQIRFDTLEGKVRLYNGHYRGAQAEGAVPSLSHMQVAEDLRHRRR